MTIEPEDPRAEALLHHASAIRALARRLVRDPEVAEDLVQDTWVAALTHAPALDRPLRPWLGAVLRNFARRSQRRAAARPAAETAASVHEPPTGPADVSEGIEAAQLLTEEVARLEDPYRSAVYLRYYQELAPVEIARRLGLPPATVRSHLKRGLARLRAELDGRFGGERGSWCVLLAPLIRSKTAATTNVAAGSIATAGVLAMNASLKIGAVAAAIVVSYLGFTLAGDPAESSGLSTNSQPPEQVGLQQADVARATAPATASARERQAVEVEVAAASTADARETTPAEPVRAAFVEAALVDSSGVGIAGARLTRVMSGARTTSDPSGTDGRVQLALDVGAEPSSTLVEASAIGFASVVERVPLERGETVRLGTLTLQPGGSVSGVVVDERGRGIEGALVTAQDAGAAFDLERLRYSRAEYTADPGPPVPPFAVTDPTGAFTLAGLPVQHVRVWAETRRSIPGYTAPTAVRAGQDTPGVEVVLETIGEHNSIEGVVVTPGGDPVPNALLDYRNESQDLHYSFATRKTAEADGTFRFVLARGSVLSIVAHDPDDRFGPAAVKDLGPEHADLVLTLSGGEDVDLVAFGGSGAELDDFHFAILAADDEQVLQRGQSTAGVASFRRPAQDFLVRVSAPLHSARTAGPLTPQSLSGSLEVRLTPVPGIAGQVLANGAPVADARVRLHALVPAAQRLEQDGFRCWLTPSAMDTQATDTTGAFRLTATRAGEYVVQVEHPGHALAEWGPIHVDPEVAGDPISIELGIGGAIEGRVTLASGDDPTGAIVALNRGDGRGRTARVEADGAYRFELLTPGPWNVEIREHEAGRSGTGTSPAVRTFADEVPWSCEVVAGQTTVHDLHVADPRTFVLQGRIGIDSVPNAALTAFVCPKGSDFFSSRGGWKRVTPDEQGRFELGVAQEGDYVLVISHMEAREIWMILDEIRVDASLPPWELELSTGSVEVTGIDRAQFDADMPPWVFTWHGDGVVFLCLPIPASDACRMERVPAGTGALVRPSFETVLEPSKWETLVEVEVTRGETARIAAPAR